MPKELKYKPLIAFWREGLLEKNKQMRVQINIFRYAKKTSSRNDATWRF